MQFTRLLSMALVLGLLVSLSACGGKDDKDKADGDQADKQKTNGDKDKTNGGKTKTNGGSDEKKAAQKLIGKWNFDSAATLTKIESEANTEKEKQALEFAKAMISQMKMSFEFTEDNKMIMSMTAGEKTETKEGTYKIKSEEGSTVVFEGTVDGEAKDVTAVLMDDNTLELNMPEGEGPGAMVLKRAN